MRLSALLPVFAGVVLFACSGQPPKPAPAASPDAAPAPVASAADDNALDIGDVEFAVSCVLTIAEADRAGGVTVKELKDYKKNLSMVTADYAGPRPATVPVTCHLESAANYIDTPVALRGRVFREVSPGDKQEIGAFTAVAGAMATDLPERGFGLPPAQWTFDAAQGLDSLPDSMLITVELTMLLTPPGTKELDLDPATVEVEASMRSVEISNPLRLNFQGDAQGTPPVTAVSATPEAANTTQAPDVTQ